MASGSSSSGNENLDEAILLEDLRNTDFVNQALPTILACVERGGFDEATAPVLYSMLRFLHTHMLDSVEGIRRSQENVINIAQKASENDAAINVCAQLINSAASPQVLRNFTPDQRKEIVEFQHFLTTAGVNPELRGRKRKFQDPKDEEIARLKSKIAALNEELEYQKDIHEKLLIRFENMDTQFNVYRYENERMLSECSLNSQMIRQACLTLPDVNGA